MIGKKFLNSDLIFYHPNIEGSIFKCRAGSRVSPEIVEMIKIKLEEDTGKEVAYVEDRRANPRDGDTPA